MIHRTRKKYRTIEEAFAELHREINLGLAFSGRGAIDACDLTDHYKQNLCAKIIRFCNENNLDVEDLQTRARAIALTEVRAVLAYRTERLTLERLCELYLHLSEDKAYLVRLKQQALKVIAEYDSLPKLKLNPQIRGLVQNGNTNILSLDFLISLIEKLDLISGSAKDMTFIE